jgi:hypothetical protein
METPMRCGLDGTELNPGYDHCPACGARIRKIPGLKSMGAFSGLIILAVIAGLAGAGVWTYPILAGAVFSWFYLREEAWVR